MALAWADKLMQLQLASCTAHGFSVACLMRRSPLLLVYSSAHWTYATLPVTWVGVSSGQAQQAGSVLGKHSDVSVRAAMSLECKKGPQASRV